MDLTVNKDEPGVASGGQLPINKREIKTQVLVDNGETVVLGGVYEQRTNQSVTRVPFLSDLPFIGNLFKRRSNDDSRTELLIFVTPKIIKETS
jgi:type IV pilus assembly protein PilQ